MKTFKAANLKNSDDQTNIEKYRVTAKCYRMSYYLKINLTKN